MIGYRIFFLCLFLSSFVYSDTGYLTSINLSVGTLNGGTLLSTYWDDDYYYNVSEVVANPGIVIYTVKNDLLTENDFNVTVCSAFSEADENIHVYAYNYVLGDWEFLANINSTCLDLNYLLDVDLFLNEEETLLRFLHDELGNDGHYIQIDQISYLFTALTPTTSTTSTTLEVLSTSNASTTIYYTSYGEENYAIETCNQVLGCEIYTFNESFLVGGYPSIRVPYWGIYDYVTNIIPEPFNSSDLNFWYKELSNKWLRWISAILIFIFAFLSLRQIYATFINRF